MATRLGRLPGGVAAELDAGDKCGARGRVPTDDIHLQLAQAAGWTRADWLRLAAAALDQAGTPGSASSDGPAIAELADLLEDETGRDADGNCTDCGAAGHGYPDCPPALRGLADELVGDEAQGDSP